MVDLNLLSFCLANKSETWHCQYVNSLRWMQFQQSYWTWSNFFRKEEDKFCSLIVLSCLNVFFSSVNICFKLKQIMFTTERNIKIEHSDISTFFICYLGYIYYEVLLCGRIGNLNGWRRKKSWLNYSLKRSSISKQLLIWQLTKNHFSHWLHDSSFSCFLCKLLFWY